MTESGSCTLRPVGGDLIDLSGADVSATGLASTPEPIRIVRVIARLNIGGPAIQAITLTSRLTEYGYETKLLRGAEEPDEGNMDHLARELCVHPWLISTMRRNPGWRDLPALATLTRIIRSERPQIVHTHAAKGGTLGRVATLMAFPARSRRPVLVHTYHGHSLTGYFSSRTAATYRRIEQLLAARTDRLIAVSPEVRDELVALGVAPEAAFEVVPLGFDLSPFQVAGPARESMRSDLRRELGIPRDARVLTLIARLAPIKRVDRFLRVANLLADLPDLRFLIVGDGEMRNDLRTQAEARAISDRLVWAGFRLDMPAVYAASDVVIQTSDNEGTPVSLIEAQASGVPVVSTRVGGAATAVEDARLLIPPHDEQGLEAVTRKVLTDRDFSDAIARRGQARVFEQFGEARLLSDIDAVYRALLK